MAQEGNQALTKKEMENLLSQQTIVILNAVDEKLTGVNQKMAGITQEMTGIGKKIVEMESRINQKFDHLITTLDRFLKRLTDVEDEFTIMKHDIARVKQVIREKLDVDLS